MLPSPPSQSHSCTIISGENFHYTIHPKAKIVEKRENSDTKVDVAVQLYLRGKIDNTVIVPRKALRKLHNSQNMTPLKLFKREK